MFLKLIEITQRHFDEDIVYNLLSSWRNNGQIISEEDVILYKSKNEAIVSVYTPSDNSLDKKWNNSYVNLWWNKLLENKSLITIHNIAHRGDAVTSEKLNCDFLVLYYDIHDDCSPLKNGSSFESIPLYLLPKTYDDCYYDIISWFNNYKMIYFLEESDLSSNRLIQNELYDINSILNRNGRKLCKKIEQLTKTPTYYYLRHYTYKTTIKKEINRQIGTQKNSITRKVFENEYFQLINDKERLVSNITPNMIDHIL